MQAEVREQVSNCRGRPRPTRPPCLPTNPSPLAHPAMCQTPPHPPAGAQGVQHRAAGGEQGRAQRGDFALHVLCRVLHALCAALSHAMHPCAQQSAVAGLAACALALQLRVCLLSLRRTLLALCCNLILPHRTLLCCTMLRGAGGAQPARCHRRGAQRVPRAAAGAGWGRGGDGCEPGAIRGRQQRGGGGGRGGEWGRRVRRAG